MRRFVELVANKVEQSAVWKEEGGVWNHSTSVVIAPVKITPRWTTKASHKIKIKYNRAMNDTIDPIDDTTFHLVNESG